MPVPLANYKDMMTLWPPRTAIMDANASTACGNCFLWEKDTVLQPCGHQYCRGCVIAFIDKGRKTCPFCNREMRRFIHTFPQ